MSATLMRQRGKAIGPREALIRSKEGGRAVEVGTLIRLAEAWSTVFWTKQRNITGAAEWWNGRDNIDPVLKVINSFGIPYRGRCADPYTT